MNQYTKALTIDTLEILYWDARDSNHNALAEAIGIALDAAIEVKANEPTSWADIAKCGHVDCRTQCHLDDAPAHGIQRPRVDCQCL